MPDVQNYREAIHLKFLSDHNWPLPIEVSFIPARENGVEADKFSLSDKDLIRFRNGAIVVYTSRGAYVRVLFEGGGLNGSNISPNIHRIPPHLDYLTHIVSDSPVPITELRYERPKNPFNRDVPDQRQFLENLNKKEL